MWPIYLHIINCDVNSCKENLKQSEHSPLVVFVLIKCPVIGWGFELLEQLSPIGRPVPDKHNQVLLTQVDGD